MGNPTCPNNRALWYQLLLFDGLGSDPVDLFGLSLMSADAPVFCICGPSAAGKTTFAAAVQQKLASREVAVLQIACDDYYRSDWIPHPLFGYDTVEAVDGDALRHDLVRASKHQATSLRLYDMRSRRVDRRPIASNYDLILLEGSYGPQELWGDSLWRALFISMSRCRYASTADCVVTCGIAIVRPVM